MSRSELAYTAVQVRRRARAEALDAGAERLVLAAAANSARCGISVRRPPLSGPQYFTWKPVCCGRTSLVVANSGAGWTSSAVSS